MRCKSVSLRSVIVAQFKKPHGLLGAMAGFIMANRPSNIERNIWTVDLMDLKPEHAVLEFGCGPGLALKACAAKVTDGLVVGIDHSAEMVRQSSNRLADEIGQGVVQIKLGTLTDIKATDQTFDRVFSLNVIQFVPDMQNSFNLIHDRLKPGGMVATTYQPRSKNPTRENAVAMARQIETAMEKTGFRNIERHELPLRPVPAICVTGVRQ